MDEPTIEMQGELDPCEVVIQELDEELMKAVESPIKSKRHRRRRHHKRRQKVQDYEMIRELSPQLDVEIQSTPELQVMKNVSGHENSAIVQEEGENEEDEVIDIVDHQEQKHQEQDASLNESQALVHIIDGKRLVDCNICKRRMTESRLATHIRLLHVEPGSETKNDENSRGKCKEFQCDHCGRRYASKYSFEQHVKTHIEGRPKCPECGTTFASSFSLLRHRAKLHNMEHNFKTYTCDVCDKVHFSPSELSIHKLRHAPEKSYECPECKKMFSAKGNLNIHMRTHSNVKLYRCDICEQSFTHPYSLVNHRRIHANEFPFKCEHCDRNFRSKHQLTSHANVHSDDRPFHCDLCTKTFKSRTAFRMHQDEHMNIKRFECQYCKRKFQCQANKAKHERRHVGVKRFTCEHCEKGFIERQELRNHLQRVHEQPSKQASDKSTKRKSKRKATGDKNPVDEQVGECETSNQELDEAEPIRERELAADEQESAEKLVVEEPVRMKHKMHEKSKKKDKIIQE